MRASLKALFVVVLVAAAAAGGYALRGSAIFIRPVTLTSLSPDDALRVALIELPRFDRNFELRLQDVRTGTTRTVCESPDEGRPVGSERIVWSTDSSRFLLLGRRFRVRPPGILSHGEQAYLMMDVRSGQLWCNATQQSAHPGFGIAELRVVRWLGWTPP